MASRAAVLVAGIIDRIEGRPLGTGRPPMPTVKVVEALRFFAHERRAMAGTASHGRARVRLHLAPAPGGLEHHGLAAPGAYRPGPDGARRT